MIRLLVLATLFSVLPAPAQNLETGRDSMLFQEYQARLRGRRTNALYARRQMNAGKVYRYYSPAVQGYSVFGPSAIQSGWVQQPPIPRPVYRSGFSCRPSRQSFYHHSYGDRW